jgi:hypothetical protein
MVVNYNCLYHLSIVFNEHGKSTDYFLSRKSEMFPIKVSVIFPTGVSEIFPKRGVLGRRTFVRTYGSMIYLLKRLP